MITTGPLRRLLVELGISNRQLAELCGLKYDQVLAMTENEKRIKLDTIDKICKTLRVQPKDIIQFEDTVSDLSKAIKAVEILSDEDKEKLRDMFFSNKS